MNRRRFIQTAGLLPLAYACMRVTDLNKLASQPSGSPMPVLFVGHGSPMNAIEQNEFSMKWREVAGSLPRPQAILCVSAHWETKGTMVTAMPSPRTIHDFGGFPKALFDVQYPAPGSPWLADETKQAVTRTLIEDDHRWGLDHGCWSVLNQMYPDASIPVVQLSLDYTKPPAYHYELASELATLRQKGVLILCSGNMVHNLGMVAWERLNEAGFAYDWALEADALMKQHIHKGDFASLAHYDTMGSAMKLAVPTPEHFLPLLYALALKNEKDSIAYFNDKAIAGSLTMTSLLIA